MKKLLCAAAALPLLAIATPAAADSLSLAGQVDYQCDFTLEGQASSTLNMNVFNRQLIGGATVTCNDPDGFALTIDSANDSVLKNGDFEVPYVFSLNPAGANSTAALFYQGPADTTIEVNTFNPTAARGATNEIGIDLNQVVGEMPGGLALTDTITFTIDGLD